MNVNFLDLKKNYLTIKNEVNEKISQILDKSNYILGEDVKIFENNFSKYLGLEYFIGVANGTDALEIAIQSLELEDNSEILVQDNTFISTCLGIISNNHKIVNCDIDPETFMIDLEDLKNKITRKSKVLIIVHLYGLVPNMNDIVKICEDNNIILIEDCAQAHGASFEGRKVGTYGKLSCFSFYPGKNLGAYGDAGGIGTNNKFLYEKICKIRNTGSIVKYEHEIIGRNSRLDTLQAGILDIKLKYLDVNNENRRNIAKIYYEQLYMVKEIELPKIIDNTIPVWHLFVIKTDKRDELKDFLCKNGITSLIHYPKTISQHNAFKKLNLFNCVNSLNTCNRILSLPIYPELEETSIIYVCDKIKEFYIEENKKKLISIKTKNKLGILHCLNKMDFNTKRLFYIDNFQELNNLKNENLTINKNNINTKRGLHANINFDELLIILDGKIEIKIIDKNLNNTIKIMEKNDCILIERMNWIEFEILMENTLILVLANEDHYNSKGIFNFEDFINFKE